MLTLADADSKTDVSRKLTKMRKRRQIRAGGSRCGALLEKMVAQPGRRARHSAKEGALGEQGTCGQCAQHRPLLLPSPLPRFHSSSDDWASAHGTQPLPSPEFPKHSSLTTRARPYYRSHIQNMGPCHEEI